MRRVHSREMVRLTLAPFRFASICDIIQPSSNLFRPTFLTLSPARRLAGSPPRTAAALRPAALILSFLAGEDFLNKEWRQGSGGNTLWSLSVCSAILVHWQGRCTLGIRLGLFPLWLRAPKCLGATCSSHSLPAGRELGAALVWGEDGILSPARAPPRSFGVRPSHNPSPRFH
jgi:hypothetical protein